MFQLQNVTKIYRKRQQTVTAFRSDSLRIADGEYLAVVGPSGSGKTTLLSMLGGMLSPDSGKVLLGDVSLYDLSVAERTRLRREKIGFVFQTFNLIPYLTAIENVQVPLFLNGLSATAQQARAAELLEQVGLADRLQHKPGEMSIGQQQRVALARTLANEPQVILADEPTGNLDPTSREHVLGLFDQFRREGRTIVMVTHDPAAADRAGRRLILQEGATIDIATPETQQQVA